MRTRRRQMQCSTKLTSELQHGCNMLRPPAIDQDVPRMFQCPCVSATGFRATSCPTIIDLYFGLPVVKLKALKYSTLAKMVLRQGVAGFTDPTWGSYQWRAPFPSDPTNDARVLTPSCLPNRLATWSGTETHWLVTGASFHS